MPAVDGAVPRHDRRSASSIPSGSPRTAPPAASARPSAPTPRIPGLVSDVGDVLDTAVKRARRARPGSSSTCRKAVQALEREAARARSTPRSDTTRSPTLLDDGDRRDAGGERARGRGARALEQEMELFRRGARRLQVRAHAALLHGAREEAKRAAAACCRSPSTRTPARAAWSASRSAPTTRCAPVTQTARHRSRSCASTGTSGSTCRPRRKSTCRIDDLEQGIGALETLLLDKTNYLAMLGGDGACLGCAREDRRCTCSPRRSKR